MINATFSQQSLDTVRTLLFEEGTQQAPQPQPCPPKQPKPAQPVQPPAQPAQPAQPQPAQPVTATQQDPTVVRQKKPKCAPQTQQTGQQNAVNHNEWMDFTRCQRPNGTHYGTAGQCRKGTQVGYEEWDTLAKGNYGEIKVDPTGTRVVKTLLTHNGQKGEFGPHEVEIAKKMGELGHSPRIYAHDEDHIEMDRAQGATLWKKYARAEGEPQMNAVQATKAAASIRDLHKMGFAHGDLHSLQFIVDGDNVKLVDFGLSVPTIRQPARVMQDLAKIGPLLNWKNPELKDDPYVQLVNKHLDRYKEVQGQSKAAKAKRTQIGEEYLKELNTL